MSKPTQNNNWQDLLDAVCRTNSDAFDSLIMASRLDPTCQLRFKDWSGCDFSNADLSGFDFTGARLHGCDFKGAKLCSRVPLNVDRHLTAYEINFARLDQAELGRVLHGRGRDPHLPAEMSAIAQPRDAIDWDVYIENWQKSISQSLGGHLPVGAIFQDAPFAPEMVVVPAGESTSSWAEPPIDENNLPWLPVDQWPGMTTELGGADEPKRRVHTSFAVSRFAITTEEFHHFVKTTRHNFRRDCFSHLQRNVSDEISFLRPGFRQEARHPVVCIGWQDAMLYVKWLSGTTGASYRLLTDAEWEYVARAGTKTAYWFGDTVTLDQANFAAHYLHMGTVPVDAFAPNPWGLYQVHGNVWEWTDDIWNSSGSRHVVRGGAWTSDRKQLDNAHRSYSLREQPEDNIGFRVARTL